MTAGGTRDLCEQICPFVVMDVVRAAFRMERGMVLRFVVDDPLAIKSIPEELGDVPGFAVRVDAHEKGWLITVTRD